MDDYEKMEYYRQIERNMEPRRNYILEHKIETFHKRTHDQKKGDFLTWTEIKHHPDYMDLVDECIAAGVFRADARDNLDDFEHERLYCAMLDPVIYASRYCAGVYNNNHL